MELCFDCKTQFHRSQYGHCIGDRKEAKRVAYHVSQSPHYRLKSCYKSLINSIWRYFWEKLKTYVIEDGRHGRQASQPR